MTGKRTVTFRIQGMLLAGMLIMSALFSKPLFCQTYGTANHTVTVIVQPVTVIQLNSGTVNLNITGAHVVAGQDQMTIMDQTSMLFWGTNSSARKITASSSIIAPLFTLKVVALNPTIGTAAPESILSAAGYDLLLNIGRSSGNANIRYTGVALASQGTGTDSHTITYTIQAQ